MSLILEALRKSEAERRRGQAPNLHSPAPLLARRAPPSASSLPLAMGAFAVVALSLGAWWWFTTRNRAAPSPEIANSAAVEEIERVAPSVATVVRPSPAPRAAPIATTASPSASAAAVAVAPTVVMTPPLPPSIPVLKPAVVPPPLIRPILDAPAPAVVEPALPSLAALSTAQRTALPPLKMSMHVWADVPRDRFAIVDGQRVGEGARLPGAVVVQIRTDGLVLDIDGQLYLLPRP